MTLKLLFTVNAIVAVLFGLGFFLVPAVVLAPYGITADAVATNLGRLLGAAYLGYAALTWLVRDAPDGPVRRSIVLALVIGYAVGLVAAVLGQLGGAVNALGWSTVAIFALLMLGFGYFQFMKPNG